MDNDGGSGDGFFVSLGRGAERLCQDIAYYLGSMHRRTWLRHFMWPLIRLRVQFFLLEFRFNRGQKVNEFHSWLNSDLQAMRYLREHEIKQYWIQLMRLRDRAHEQDSFDVRKYWRAPHGWLWFSGSPSKIEEGKFMWTEGSKEFVLDAIDTIMKEIEPQERPPNGK
ncbi:MAG: hypothetical protein ACHQU0_00385 [Candidatus Paceibacteria bacterium]